MAKLVFLVFLVAMGLRADGYIAHIVSGGEWTMEFIVVNVTDQERDITVWFINDNGGPLFLRVLNLGMSEGFSIKLRPNSTVVVPTLGGGGPARWGWAWVSGVSSLPSASVLAVFRQSLPRQPVYEASVPMITSARRNYVLPYDNQGGFATGVAIANTGRTAVDVLLTFRNPDGSSQSFAGVPLPVRGHMAFALTQRFPETANRSGSIEFLVQGGSVLSGVTIIGFRFNPSGPFTTIPPISKSVF